MVSFALYNSCIFMAYGTAYAAVLLCSTFRGNTVRLRHCMKQIYSTNMNDCLDRSGIIFQMTTLIVFEGNYIDRYNIDPLICHVSHEFVR